MTEIQCSTDEEISVRCYEFLRQVWPHSPRTADTDKGFERTFRRWIARKISFEALSEPHNLGLGLSYASLSGTDHELDVVGRVAGQLYIFELKNYPGSAMQKDWVFVFFHKVFDYYIKNIHILHEYPVNLVFLTTSEPDAASRQVCFTWGINLITPGIIPPPVLQYYFRRLAESSTAEGNKVETLYQQCVELNLSVIFPLSRVLSISPDGRIMIQRAFIDKAVKRLVEQHTKLDGLVRQLTSIKSHVK